MIFTFACAALALIWTWFHDIDDTPEFSGLTEAVVEVAGTAEKSQADKILDD